MREIKSGERKFYIGDDENNPLAVITYVEVGPTQLIIDHTEVSDELRGEGIAGKLVEHVVDFARKEDKKIIPLCPFAKSYIEKHEELQDVLKENKK